MNDAVVLDLIERIYAAAEDARLWDVFLERLSDALHGTFASLIFEDFHSHHTSVARAVRISPEYLRSYEEHYAATNPLIPAAAPLLRSGCVLTSQMVISDQEFHKTEYYSYLRRLDTHELLASFPYCDGSGLSHFSVGKSKRKGPFRKEDVRLLKTLSPHLQRSLQLHQRVVELRTVQEAVTDALDRVEFGVVLVDAKRRPAVVNRVAGEIFAAGDGLSCRGGEIHAASPDENGRLLRLIGEAVAVSAGTGSKLGGALSVSRPSLRRSYGLVVSPLRPRDSSFGQPGAMAAVFITDPERTPRSDPELLRQLFKFTPAEARMAALLLGGESVEEAAERLSITLNTARTHVRHLYEKTDTRRQGDFIRVLALSCVARETGKP